MRNLKFDGKDYPVEGRRAAPGSTSSARRVDERTLEITDKVNGEVTSTDLSELSPDLKTLTRQCARWASAIRLILCLNGNRLHF